MDDLVNELLRTLGSHADNVVVLDEVDSTHALALRLIGQMEDEGLELGPTVIIAFRQSHGRGRGERQWTSPSGGVYVSWIRSALPPTTIQLLPMIAAATALASLEALGLHDAAIKWPNDLLVSGRKVAGLLVHARSGDATWATVGLGVNIETTPVHTCPAPHPPTSLKEHLPDITFACAAAAICDGLLRGLEAAIDDPREALALWRSRLVHHPGDHMVVHVGGETVVTGVFTGLTPEGHLCLDCDNGPRVISSGDIIE